MTKRKFSAASRAKMAESQRKRWGKGKPDKAALPAIIETPETIVLEVMGGTPYRVFVKSLADLMAFGRLYEYLSEVRYSNFSLYPDGLEVTLSGLRSPEIHLLYVSGLPYNTLEEGESAT